MHVHNCAHVSYFLVEFFAATAWLPEMKKNSRRLPRLVEKHDTTIFPSSLWTSKDKIPTNSSTNEFVNMHTGKLNPGEY